MCLFCIEVVDGRRRRVEEVEKGILSRPSLRMKLRRHSHDARRHICSLKLAITLALRAKAIIDAILGPLMRMRHGRRLAVRQRGPVRLCDWLAWGFTPRSARRH